jgi:beta-phosphoglucomutase
MKPAALLFDMDGVIVDNHQFHLKAWMEFSKRHGFHLDEAEYKKHINGRTISATMAHFFPDEKNLDVIQALGAEKEKIYRELYAPHQKPTPGLVNFLRLALDAGIAVGVGSSAPPENIAFTLDGLDLRKYFAAIVNGSEVSVGKPAPEVYLKLAEKLGAKAEDSIVLEDALSGIEAGKNAGAKVIGLATTHPAHEISHSDLVINDFNGLTVDKLTSLFK